LTPLDEYAARRLAREADVLARERVHVWLGNAKVAIVIAVLLYWAWTLNGDPQSWVYLGAVAAFIALAIWHEAVLRAMARANAAVAFYRDGIARIEDRWMRDEPGGDRFRNADHPYADDLDVFGPRSLFQLLSLCRTPIGEARLAGWLLQGSPVPIIRERQARVRALAPRLDLRERIAVVNAASRRFIHADQLIAWAETTPSLPPLRPLVAVMAVLFVAAFFTFFNGGSGWWMVGVGAINGVLLGALFKRAHRMVEELSSATASAGVELVANVIREIEREPFDEPALVALAARLKGHDGQAASRGIARLARVSDWADSLHNAYVRLGELPFLVTLQVAYAAEAWRRRDGAAVRDWVDAIGEFEALSSLAGYSYEHPSDPFPELIESADPFFDAVEVAHPLIPAAESVSNSFALGPKTHDPRPRTLIVSGSNMSGKSTLLRTAGINAILAFAGAPVRAQQLRLTPLAVGTCLRHTDSLQEHRSGFYTEALRLRRIADLLDGPLPPHDAKSASWGPRLPVMFLFDELLSGTNSKDRRIAAEGVIRMMLAKGAIGLVTTHDLSLTEIAAIFPGEVKNVHLQDHVDHGKMAFDYKLRDGVITHSNALELMRMIGLDV
jgi:hypothetical protein